MTILRGGGGSTNIMYVAISAAKLKTAIQIQTTSARLALRRRRLGGVTFDPDENDTTRSPLRRCRDGRRISASRFTFV